MKEKIKDFWQLLRKRIKVMWNRLLTCIWPLTKRQKKGTLVVIFCLVVFFILTVVTRVIANGLYDQQAAKRWSSDGGSAQISCFYPINYEGLDDYYFLNLEHTIETALNDASLQAENENARQFVDAYSVTGTITLQSDYGMTTVQAVGVAGDFFFFHPLALYSGNYIGGDMLMQDGVIIDEDAAWQLFGSNDVTDMNIDISGIPYHIAGVTNRDEGHYKEAAGLSKSVCYVSLETLLQYGTINGSYTYELAMPDPVSDFAMTTVNTALNQQEEIIEVVENSRRYDVYPLLLTVKDFGVRSMSSSGIVYPYWENIARAYEDVFALCLFIKLIVLIVVVILGILYIHGLRGRLKAHKKEEKSYEKW